MARTGPVRALHEESGMNDSLERLALPSKLVTKIDSFRSRVRTRKFLAYTAFAALLGTLSYLIVFALDRAVDTPVWARATLALTGIAGLAIGGPMLLHRWFLSLRTQSQVACLIRKREPLTGDHVLGLVELADGKADLGQSQALRRAAIETGSQSLERRDFLTAAPTSHPKRGWVLACIPLGLTIACALTWPDAARNAFDRITRPFGDVERFTFVQFAGNPEVVNVPHGEGFELSIALSDDAQWKPERAEAKLGNQETLEAELVNGRYTFLVPPQVKQGVLEVSAGDASLPVDIRPLAAARTRRSRSERSLARLLGAHRAANRRYARRNDRRGHGK